MSLTKGKLDKLQLQDQIKVQRQLINELVELGAVAKRLRDLYEREAPSSNNAFRESVLDKIDISELVPCSIDDWHCRIVAKITELLALNSIMVDEWDIKANIDEFTIQEKIIADEL
tara:strand:+ start:134 stop:481 length:348 start_codon:yes stop_codon:yes gene_type:complete